MAWPSAPTTTGTGFASGSGTSIATGATAVTAGDLLYVSVAWEGADSTVTLSDGGVNSYSPLYASQGAPTQEPWHRAFWAVAATTTNITVTASYGGGADSRTFRTITMLVLHPDAAGTISLDGTPISNGALASGPGSISSGNLTTSTQATNCGVGICGFSFYGDDPSAELINGVAADNIQTNNGAEVWMRRYTTGFTGDASATFVANHWSLGFAAFKIVAGGGGPEEHPVTACYPI